jgi:hypothetical protein
LYAGIKIETSGSIVDLIVIASCDLPATGMLMVTLTRQLAHSHLMNSSADPIIPRIH